MKKIWFYATNNIKESVLRMHMQSVWTVYGIAVDEDGECRKTRRLLHGRPVVKRH